MSFDPSSFLDLEVNGANDTKLAPVPVGQYMAEIVKVDMRTIQVEGEDRLIAALTWHIKGEEAKAATGMEKPTVRQDLWIDLTENKGLDNGKGKNVGLGRVREAVGLNNPASTFSFRMLQGRGANVYVSHRPDKKTGDIFAEIKKVVAA